MWKRMKREKFQSLRKEIFVEEEKVTSGRLIRCIRLRCRNSRQTHCSPGHGFDCRFQGEKYVFLFQVEMTCWTATYSKVSVIHEVDIPVGRLSLGGASAFFRTKSRCQNHHIWTTDNRQGTFGMQSFFILPPCGTFEHTCNKARKSSTDEHF